MTSSFLATMEFDPDAPNTWPTDAESWYQVSYTTVTISNRQVPFPPEGYYAIFGSVFDRDPHNLSLYNAASTDVSDLLASLPQWEFTGETGDNPARTWRVIWPYHPVISTFSAGGKVNNHSDNFAVFEDLSEHVQEEIPETLDTNRDFVVFHKTLPLAIFHSNQAVRWKFANHLDRLFQERPLTPFLQPIRNNQRGLPAAPENVTRRITTALEFALQVAQGKSPPLSDSNLKKECGQRIPYIVYSKRKPVAPDLDKDFPPMSVSAAASAKAPPNIPAAKSRLPAATIATQSSPPPPPYTSEDVTAPTVATPTVLPETAAPSHLSSASSAPPPPPISAQDDMAIDPPDSGANAPMSSEAARPATDMEIEAEDPAELPPLGGIKIQALRPTVHPPQPRPTGNRIERPSFTRPALFQLFAEAFRPLPTLFSRFGDLTTKWGKRYSGWEIFTWLFPSMASKAPDPLPNPADATPATPDTPFQALVDRFVDLDSTFADARKMSQPQIVPESVDHLTFLPAPSPSPFKLPALLEFLSARIDPTLADLRAHDLSPPPFLTLIVGSPAHPLAGKALHSHLVGCFTNNETRYHFTLFVPVGHDQCLPVPLEWAPLFTALATICLYPSLPFLVCTPDYTLGTFSAVDDLIACFPRPAAFHAFSSNSSLVRPDVFLRLPPAANFTGQPVEGRPDFVSHTPAAAMASLLAARKATYQHCPSSRESVETGSLTADLHFALYCTPYYGYVPENETDFIAMTFALADFLVYTCFTTNSEPNAALSNLSVRPGDLLTILSTIHPSFLSVSPGDGLFILPLTTSKAALRPFPVAWLYSVTEEDCPPPPFFVTLGAALGPGTELYVSGIFQQAWALGPHARVYLNSSQLPLPYFRRTDDLQVHTNNRAHGADFGGYGAKQYHFVFSPDTHDKVSFANLPVTPDALPESFLNDLLALEKWPPAATLLATPNNTISWPDNSSLRMWLPDVDSNFFPHHGITVCCGRAGDRARSHGPTLGYRDIHQESADRQGAVWNSYFSHVPQYESLASVFYSTMEYWVGYTADAIPRSTIEPILTSYKELCSQYQAGLHAWRLPPHTLAYNLYTLIFSLYALDSLLLEGFGAGAYSAAVAALMAYRPPSRAEYSKFDCVLTCLGGIAMPPKIFQELLDVYYKAHSQQLELANDSAAKGHVYDESSFTHSLRIVQHVHDRISPWSLNEILLNYLYNRGVAVLTLHDGVDAQRAYAELHNQIPFKPWSHFGDYRRNYEKVVPTLKYFSAATFFASFLAPLTYEQLEAREGTLGATYCPDLLDLLLGLFSYMGIVPPLHFGATIDALTPVLLRGCHREPNGDIIPMLHTTMEIHESPEAFYSRTFLQLLRIPALKNLGFSQDDVHALEDCLRQALMNLPLPQALDFLHSQLLSSMCISPPVRKDNEPPAPFVSPPLKRHFQWPPGTPDPPPAPPSFHVWITRKVAPHMAVVDLRCDAVPWACFRRGPAGQQQHQFGIHSGNFIQFVFPATDDYPADCGFFSFALYITKVALKGRVVLENPDQVGDPSAAQVTQLVGIVLPFLLHNSVQIPGGKGVAPVSQALYQLRLPVLDRLNTTVETCVLPPISLSLSFLVPVSAFPGLFQHLVGVPFYRLPKTLGWPYSDAPLNGALIPDPPLAPLNLAPLLSLLRVLPFFTPPSVRNKVTNHLQGESGCHYTLDAIVYILEKGMRPGTKKTDGDIETTYDWPLNWEIPDFTSDLCKGLSTHHPEIFQLLTSLGRRFIAKFLIALLAADGHFITLLLSTLWGLRGGFTTLCLQGIFGSGKTYCASMMLVVATSILGIPTLLTAEPNLPLYTAADTICDLLRDASDPVRAQYARLLAQNIPVSTPIDYDQEDRANLFQENSPLRCVLITQGGLLRQLCHSYSHLSTFIKKVRLAFNDESQQGGKAGFTVIGANLPCSCLQCLTGDQEQTKAGTGGEKLQEALVDQLAHKAIGFLGGSKPHLPSSMLLSLFKALRTAQVSNLPSDRDSPFDILQYLCDSSLPFSCLPATVWEAEGMVPTAGVTLHLILPHSLRCPADTYFTQVAMHYPHLQYSSGQTVAFGHYEDPLPDQMATKLPVDLQNVSYHCSGYRLLHWSPRLSPGSNKLPPDDVANIIKVAATLSYYVARQVRRNQESSKLLILTPHNDTVDDILDAVGLPPDNLPPSLYEFYLVMIYKQQILPTTLTEFTRADHRGKPYTPHLENVTFREIHTKISTLHQDLARRATIETIVQIALDFPKGFSSYCTISNTVKAIGIGGVASVFVSCKISDFLTKTKEAQARNLVALTRSKGLCILLLPSTDRFSTSSLHSLRTLCAFRHGMFSIGASPIDIPKLTHEGTSSIYTAEIWQITHQISWYGTWHCLPLALAVSYAKHTFYFTLSLRTGVVPSSNVHQLDASAFEWKGSLPNHPSATISFAKDGLVLQAQYPMVLFPFPAGRGSTSILSTNPKGYSLRPVSGTHFFSNASFNTEHTHPLCSGLHDPDDIALPPQMIRWPRESPAVLPVALATQSQRNPVPPWLPADSKTLYQQGLEALTTEDALHNANPTHWLPAYCAHALHNFAEEHLSVLANPDTLASFSTEVVDPLLRSETSKAQEYLQGLLSTADSGYKTVLRRRPVPLTDGPQKGIIDTPKVPLPASFFHCALAIESGQVVRHWIPTPSEPTLHPPRNRPPVGAPTAEATETYLNTYADIRMEQYLRSPPVIQTGIDISDSHPPRESDHDTEILSQSATEAFQRLIDAIDNPSPTPLDIDDQLYSALAGLSSSHPWSTLVLDLQGVLHEIDRHFHTHLLSGMLQAQMVPSKIQLLNQLLQTLSAVIVDILAPATSNFNLPEIESVFFTHQFWHHHLVHGTNIATPASLEEGAPSDTLLGGQLCQWSSVGATADSLLLASHLTVHLPPRIGAYVLANHKTHASLVTDPEVAGQNSRSNYVVKQSSQFRSPIMGSDMALTAARASASAGHVPPA